MQYESARELNDTPALGSIVGVPPEPDHEPVSVIDPPLVEGYSGNPLLEKSDGEPAGTVGLVGWLGPKSPLQKVSTLPPPCTLRVMSSLPPEKLWMKDDDCAGGVIVNGA